MRWDMVTRFDVLSKGVYSKAVKSYSGTEDFFKEHFPGNPQVPQPFFIEMIAQAGGVIFGLGLDFKKEVILAKIESAEFYRQASPPCELVIEARIEEKRDDGAWIAGTVALNNEKVASARILLAAVDALTNDKKPIVFNDRFMNSYDILAVARKSEGVSIP